jgi:vacuolar-type H+-ATPase subunit H
MAEPAEEGEVAAAELASAEAMLDMIVMKEDEIRSRIMHAENESHRIVEEAKLDAADMKRAAAGAVVGEDLREKELEKARKEGERVTAEVRAQAEQIRASGMARLEDTVKIVMEGVLPPR